jgi:hypothetical protein
MTPDTGGPDDDAVATDKSPPEPLPAEHKPLVSLVLRIPDGVELRLMINGVEFLRD